MGSKIIPYSEALKLFKDEMCIMVGGFMGNGTPELLVDALIESGITGYTIVGNDSAKPGVGISRLIATKKAKKIIASHIGLNSQTGEFMATGELEVVLVPQGTLAERVRAGGAGLGGVLTETGVGTDVEIGKQKLVVNGKEYLLELPLRGDIALVYGTIIDKAGNVYCEGTTRNFNTLMAMACDTVIAWGEKVVEVGELDPNLVTIPGVVVDYIVLGGEQ